MTVKKHLKFKICLLGNPGVGKTSLIQKYVYDFFGDVYIRTMGTKVSRKLIKIGSDDEKETFEITIMIWDIMGQKILTDLHKTYFKFAKGALIVCDVTRKNTLYDSEEWVNNLYDITGKIPVMFIANKNDLKDKISFSEQDLQEIADKYDAPYLLSSAKTGENVNQAFYRLGKMMLDNALTAKPVKKETPNGEPVSPAESPATHPLLKNVAPGGCYLVKEEKPVKSFTILNKLIASGINGFCITRTHPTKVQNEFQLQNIPIKWLTSGKQEENTLSPELLPELKDAITDFIQKNPNSAILLEGIEYLIDQNDFQSVLKMIHLINDEIMKSDSIFILPLDPFILDKKELHKLSRGLVSI
jgi:small GTP-binding protein